MTWPSATRCRRARGTSPARCARTRRAAEREARARAADAASERAGGGARARKEAVAPVVVFEREAVPTEEVDTCAPVAPCSRRAARTTPPAIARTGVSTVRSGSSACHVLACAKCVSAPPSPCVHRNGPSPPSGTRTRRRAPGAPPPRGGAARARAAAAAAAALSRRRRTGRSPAPTRDSPLTHTSSTVRRAAARPPRRARARAARRAAPGPGREPAAAAAAGGPRGSRGTRAESRRVDRREHVLVRIEAEVRHPRRLAARVEPEAPGRSSARPSGHDGGGGAARRRADRAAARCDSRARPRAPTRAKNRPASASFASSRSCA